MRKLEVQEVKEVQLGIMDFVHDFCEKNNIRYWLNFGSLLGAVRHKGYIPWDDDIDIGMLRDDYNKFKNLFVGSSDRYVLHDIENDENYNFLFGKVYDVRTLEKDPNCMVTTCINIDIFIYDDIPDEEQLQKKLFKKRDFYRQLNNMQVLRIKKSSLIKTVVACLLKGVFSILPRNYFLKKFNRIIQKNNGKFNKVGNLCGYAPFVFNKSDVTEVLLVPFEDKMYRIPKGFDNLLTRQYGDYMTLPPEEKRCYPHRNIDIYML